MAAALAAEKAEGRRMIKLWSSDGLEREMSVEAARLCETIGRVLDHDDMLLGVFPLPNVASDVVDMVIAYCNKHVEVAPAAGNNSDPSSGAAVSSSNPAPAATKEDVEKWDNDFIEGLEPLPYLDLLRAAIYLEITGLIILTGRKARDIMKGKTLEQILAFFRAARDYTKAEEAEIRQVLLEYYRN